MTKVPRGILRTLSDNATARPPLTVGIRREDPARIWERRCPLTPDAVHKLVSRGVRVLVQDCDRRVFSVREFVKAGATIRNNLEDAHIIIGIKETPLAELITSPVKTPASSITQSPWVARTHLMFSHTAKGQSYNTPLLARFLPLQDSTTKSPEQLRLAPRLIDYEYLTDGPGGKRTVAFGWFAGVAGVLESLSAMAHYHLETGIASPFLYTPRPHTQPSLDNLRKSLREIGAIIRREGTPERLGPFIIGLTGNGNVSQGCLSMLNELPISRVKVKDLPHLVNASSPDYHKIYLCHARPEDYLTTLDGRSYDREHYYSSPQSYRSDFAEKVAPYLTLFLNGAGWSPAFPRLMTNEQLTTALHRANAIGGARFMNIGDISCDIEGGLQFMTRSSTNSSPFYKVRPASLPSHLPPVQIMSIDILPASIPLDASSHFSKALFPYLNSLIHHYENEKATDVDMSALNRATIAMNGTLMEQHKWLQESVDRWREQERKELNGAAAAGLVAGTGMGVVEMQTQTRDGVDEGKVDVAPTLPSKKKRILMLGSGMVAGPVVDEIAKRSDVQLLVASNSLREIEQLTEKHLNVKHRLIDMNDLRTVSELIGEADVVISLLPAPLHPVAAELCIQHRKHLVTASYISPEMHALHKRALEADVLLLNEIGLDPGIDHCSAISLIDKLRSQDKKIVSFISFCGGLPAPDTPIVPLRYKFSWSPRGVLAAALNGARYKLNNTIWNIPGESILKSYFPKVPVSKELDLEGIANRDSLPYLDTYKLGPLPSIRTLLRGTLRYPGFSDLMHSFKSLGLLETRKTIYLERWSSLIRQSLALKMDKRDDVVDIVSAVKSVIPTQNADALYEALEWLSLLPSSSAGGPVISLPPLPNQPMAPIDLFSILLAHKLRYKPNERDMVIMSHEITAKPNKGGAMAKEEVHTSSLAAYGTIEASAMARTVGLPVAFAALRVLDGGVAVRGVVGPGDPSVYKYVLSELESVGLGMKESMRIVEGKEGEERSLEKVLIP